MPLGLGLIALLPVLVDSEGPDGPIVLWESGAILRYLAETSGFLQRSGPGRYEELKWLHFQVAHAPYLGDAQLYRVMYREALPAVIKRFTVESTRIYQALNDELAERDYVAGSQYSIADMAWYPWIEYREWKGQDLEEFLHLRRWFERIGERPAVRRGSRFRGVTGNVDRARLAVV